MPDRRSLVRYAWLSIAAALATIALKVLAWWLTASVGLLADALESLVNLAAAIVTLWMLALAARPPDEAHAFGYTKAEYLASGFEGALIVVAAAAIAAAAVERLVTPRLLAEVGPGLAVSTAASLVTLGVARVLALIGVGILSALIVLALKQGAPFGTLLVALAVVAPLAGILHWLESWLAHDMAFRLLAHMRLDFFRKLDALAPAYLTRRRSGDLVGVATNDIELIEYFFAHTITPAFVAVLIPAGVLATLSAFGWPLAGAVLPFLAYVGLSPMLARARVDQLGSRAREAVGEMNAHAVDTCLLYTSPSPRDS